MKVMFLMLLLLISLIGCFVPIHKILNLSVINADNQVRYLEIVNQLDKDRNKLASEALRKTTLLPNQKLCGKIYLRIPTNTISVRLFFPIDSRKMFVDYENRNLRL